MWCARRWSRIKSGMSQQLISWHIYSQSLLERPKLILFVISWACTMYMLQYERVLLRVILLLGVLFLLGVLSVFASK